MEGININIDAEAVERKVVEAIIESSIGKKIKAGVENIENLAGNKMFSCWVDDAVEKAVKDEVEVVVRTHVRENETVQALIKARAEEFFTETAIDKMLDAIWKGFNSRY